jgi:MFS family permease
MSPMFRSLRVRNYRLFAAGQIVSNTGTWMQRVAQDWLVLNLSHSSGTALGITTGLQFLPLLLFGLYGGVIADRYPKRRTLMVTQAAMGLFAACLGVLDLAGVAQLWHVYALAFALGVVTVVDNPTRQAFATELVGSDDLPNAVGLNSATFNAGRVVGPAVAGLLISRVGTGLVFLINAASYIAVIAGLWLMRERELYLTERRPADKGSLRAGLRYVRARPQLMLPILLVGFVATFGLNFQVTTALMARNVFHMGAGSYGLLGTALAIGSLAGALLAARRERPRLRLVVGSALAFGLLEVIVGLMPSYWSFALLLVPVGVAALTFTTAANASVQLAASPVMRGRVMAVYMFVFLGGAPIGSPIVGWVGQAFGPRWSLLVGGLVSAVAAAVIGIMVARRSRLTLDAGMRPRAHVHVQPTDKGEAGLLQQSRAG